MALTGSLAKVGLPGLFTDLLATRRTGKLRVSAGGWTAVVDFDRGCPVSAFFGDARGLPAIEALAFALPAARFRFADSRSPGEARNLAGAPGDIQEYLARLQDARDALALPDELLAAVPRMEEVAPGEGTAGEVTVGRAAVRTLGLVDGRRTVEEIVQRRRSAEAVTDLVALAELRLISFGRPVRRVSRRALDELRYWRRSALLAGLSVALVLLQVAQAARTPTTPHRDMMHVVTERSAPVCCGDLMGG